MSENKQLFDMASLSEAAYADFVVNGVLQISASAGVMGSGLALPQTAS